MPFPKNKKNCLPIYGICLWLIAFCQLTAQDLILLRSGEKLNVQILGITKDAITFRHPDVPPDSLSALPIIALQQIQYANGLEQHFFLPDENQKKIGRIQSPMQTTPFFLDTLIS